MRLDETLTCLAVLGWMITGSISLYSSAVAATKQSVGNYASTVRSYMRDQQP